MMHVYPSLCDFFIDDPITPGTNSKIKWAIKKYQCWRINVRHNFSVCSLVWFQLKQIIYIFVEISFYPFIQIHTREIRVRKQYIIIYTKKRYHFTWTSVLNFLIGLLPFFEVQLTIIYDDTKYLFPPCLHHFVTRQEILKSTRMDYDKIHQQL